MAEIITPTRDSFARFLTNQRDIIAFEELFKRINELTSSTSEDSGSAVSNQTTGTGIANEIRSKSNNVLLWLSED